MKKDAVKVLESLVGEQIENEALREYVMGALLSDIRTSGSAMAQAIMAGALAAVDQQPKNQYPLFPAPLNGSADNLRTVEERTTAVVMLVLKDGLCIQPKEGDTYDLDEVIGVSIQEPCTPAVIVYPKSLGEMPWENEDDARKFKNTFRNREDMAIMDFDGKSSFANMEGTALFDAIKKESEQSGNDLYLPALGELLVITRHIDEVNAILEHINGSDPIDKESYSWCSTEYNGTYAWTVYPYNGLVYSNGKSHSYVVRPVSAFNLYA